MSAYTSIAIGTKPSSKRIIICGGTLNLGLSPLDNFGEDETYIYTQNCVLAGDITAKDLHLHTGSFQTVGVPTIKIAGNPGRDSKENSSKNSRTGGTGHQGHSFFFSSADFDYRSRFKVDATGGDGGRGYFDATGQGGGSGGDGGPGGIINIMYEDSYQRTMNGYIAYEYALSKEDSDHPENTERMVKQAARDFVNVVHIFVESDKEYNKAVIDSMADLYKQLNQTDSHGRSNITMALKDVKEAMKKLRKTLEFHKPGDGLLADLMSTAANYGGFPGRGNNYEDRPNRYGGMGIYGKKGDRWAHPFMDYGMIWDRDIFLYHPEQMAFTLRDAYAEYFQGAGGRNTQGIKNCALILGQLINRLGFLNEIDPKNPTNKADSSLWKTFKRYEASMLVLPSTTASDSMPATIRSLQRTYTQAVAYMVQLNSGQDIYGHTNTWVPVGSYEYYKEQVDKFLEHFEDIEKRYTACMKRYKDETITKADVESAINDARIVKAKTEWHQTKTKDLIDDVIPAIERFNKEIAPKRKLVLDSIKKVESKIKDSSVVPIKDFIQSAVSFCFLPSKWMAVTVSAQALWDLAQGASSIEDDSGAIVKKAFLINQLQEMDGTIESLKDGAELIQAGSLKPEDAGGPKLVAEKKKLFELIQKYKSLIEDWKDIQEQFDDYIDTVVARNDRALQYNQYLVSLWQDQSTLEQIQDNIDRLESKKKLDDISPNLTAMALLVKQSYYAAVDRIFRVLYLTERALLFWTLGEPLKKFDEIRKGGIDSGNLYVDLKSLSDTIVESYNNALENTTSAYQKFGDWGETNGANTPLTYTLSATELKHFQNNEEQVSVNMANAWAQTTKAKNVFLGKYDVRLTKVRCLIEGDSDFNTQMKDKTISVDLVHPGLETIVDKSKHAHRFDHNQRKLTFEYTHPFDRKSPKITTDGDLYKSPNAKGWEYARAGPFTTWNIILAKGKNPDLETKTTKYREKITKVTMEFTGWAKTL
ncbi:hypothetical protein F5Y12DRAFT_89943 [Xylaria sp. FL1777]|nr:hypothetical protein F5Y12DRAFT_89943 [Xylaria sp. FL1777]